MRNVSKTSPELNASTMEGKCPKCKEGTCKSNQERHLQSGKWSADYKHKTQEWLVNIAINVM